MVFKTGGGVMTYDRGGYVRTPDNSPSDIPPYHARLELELEVGLVGLGLSLVWLVSGLGFELG